MNICSCNYNNFDNIFISKLKLNLLNMNNTEDVIYMVFWLFIIISFIYFFHYYFKNFKTKFELLSWLLWIVFIMITFYLMSFKNSNPESYNWKLKTNEVKIIKNTLNIDKNTWELKLDQDDKIQSDEWKSLKEFVNSVNEYNNKIGNVLKTYEERMNDEKLLKSTEWLLKIIDLHDQVIKYCKDEKVNGVLFLKNEYKRIFWKDIDEERLKKKENESNEIYSRKIRIYEASKNIYLFMLKKYDVLWKMPKSSMNEYNELEKIHDNEIKSYDEYIKNYIESKDDFLNKYKKVEK